jgi:broad specificity phosphatase PhoE
MSRIFLLRHAQSEANAKGILAGRLENISLSKTGLKERELLNDRFMDTKFDRIISSPIQRCLQTIQEISSSPEIVHEFSEVDYGDWTGRKMTSLMRNKAWREIHKNPASVRFPNGETLPEVQTRALLGLDSILQNSGKKSRNFLISTHADVIKVLILHALGTHLNNIDKVSIDNASISIIDKTDNGLRVVRVNDNTSKVAGLLK